MWQHLSSNLAAMLQEKRIAEHDEKSSLPSVDKEGKNKLYGKLFSLCNPGSSHSTVHVLWHSEMHYACCK